MEYSPWVTSLYLIEIEIAYNVPMFEIVRQLKKTNPDLKEREIEGVLFILKNNLGDSAELKNNSGSRSGLKNNELITLTGLPKETLKIFKSSMSNLLEKNEEYIKLNEEGSRQLSSLDLRPYLWTLVDIGTPELAEKIQQIRHDTLLKEKREFDQFFATYKTTSSKAAVLYEKGMVDGKNIAILGDDDLVSVALGIKYPNYNKITVFDIDDAILNTVKTLASELGLKNIETVNYDARKDLPHHFEDTYDVVTTDPPYTSGGISLFLNRGIQLLNKSKDYSGTYIFLFYGNSFKSPEKTLKIQELILDYGLLIEDKIDKFARYSGAESVGNASSLYILKLTPFIKNIPVLSKPEIYTFENVKEEKFPFVDHYTFKFFKVPRNVLISKKDLVNNVESFCAAHKLKIVDTKITNFKKSGLSLTFILSTSNLLLHTWPEFSALHIDLITCVPIYNKENMVKTLSKAFNSFSVEARKIE